MHQTLEQGTVVAVCLRPESGVPKYPQPEIAIGTHGVEGDFHSGPINKHKKTGDPEPNTRHVTIVAQEALEAVNGHLQVDSGLRFHWGEHTGQRPRRSVQPKGR